MCSKEDGTSEQCQGIPRQPQPGKQQAIELRGRLLTNTSIFCTYPAEFMTKTGQFFSEFIASALLMFLIYALKDDGNIGAGPLTPLALFFVIFGIGGTSSAQPPQLIESGLRLTCSSLFWLGDWLCHQSGSRLWATSDVVSGTPLTYLAPLLTGDRYFLGYGHEVWSAGDYVGASRASGSIC
jgi:Major intrinsic protein